MSMLVRVWDRIIPFGLEVLYLMVHVLSVWPIDVIGLIKNIYSLTQCCFFSDMERYIVKGKSVLLCR